MKEKYKKYIGNKAFYMMVMAIAVPIMIQNGLTNFVNLLDNIMVGRLGTEEMSGVSIVNQIIFVYNLCIFGGTAGVGIFTAQYFGQKNDEGIRSTFRYKIWLALIITVGAAFLLLFFGKQLILLYLMGENGGNEKLALEYGMTYLRIILLDLPAFMILQVYASTMRECGETADEGGSCGCGGQSYFQLSADIRKVRIPPAGGGGSGCGNGAFALYGNGDRRNMGAYP